jgi:hypothetical protein
MTWGIRELGLAVQQFDGNRARLHNFTAIPMLDVTQSPAAQAPVHDAVLDSVALRAWVNLPHGSNLEGDLYKAANIVARFTQVGCSRTGQDRTGQEGVKGT